jgi:hypothetical protein
VAVVPPQAELEAGFEQWVGTVQTISKEAGLPLLFYAASDTIMALQERNALDKALTSVAYHNFENWDDFLIFSKVVKANDLFLIVSSRPEHPSYIQQLTKLPYYLATYFTDNSYLLLFPPQTPLEPEVEMAWPQVEETPVPAQAGGLRGYFKGLFRR